MPRIEIELTSSRPDGTWTWRAAGARHPKGALDGAILYSGAKVGDVVRAESEMGLDGITVTAVSPPKTKRQDPERLTLLGSGREEPGVIGDGVAAARRGEKLRSDRPRGRDRSGEDRDARRAANPRSERRPVGNRSGDDTRPRTPRPDRPRPDARERPARAEGQTRGEPRLSGPRPDRRAGAPARGSGPPRPRAKKLQAGRKHRDEALAALPPEQRPVAEHVLRGGMAAVRQALAEQNSRARASGEPEVRADALITMAEGLVAVLRSAEWRDRADAAVADMENIALRDLRAVVAGSDAAPRDDDTRALIGRLREGLDQRSKADQEAWLNEIRGCLADGRLVRALRVSARPPEPAARLPEDMAQQISDATGTALAPDVATERWMALLEAAMSSPVRTTVRPKGLPAQPTADLRKAVMLATPRMPGLREALGSDSPTSGSPRIPPPPSPARPRDPSSDNGDDAVLVEELG